MKYKSKITRRNNNGEQPHMMEATDLITFWENITGLFVDYEPYNWHSGTLTIDLEKDSLQVKNFVDFKNKFGFQELSIRHYQFGIFIDVCHSSRIKYDGDDV